MTTITVSNASQLQAAFAVAKDGDRIELTGGNYGSVMLAGRSFANGISVASADPSNQAVLEDLKISKVTGLTLADIEVDGTKLGPNGNQVTRLFVSGSHNLTLTGLTIEGHIPTAAEGADPNAKTTTRMEAITGYGYDLGLRFLDCSNITVSQSDFADLRGAVALTRVTDITMTGLDIHDVREGVDMSDVRGVTIEKSQFHDFKPWRPSGSSSGDHPDMIQFWGINSSYGVHDLTIRNNMFVQTEDNLPTQTIFGSVLNSGASVTATNFVIEDNVIVNGHVNAIALYGVNGVLIDDNLILPNSRSINDPVSLNTPSIVLVQSHNATISGNSYVPLSGIQNIKVDLSDPTIHVASDNTVMSTSPTNALYWRNYAGSLLDSTTGGLGTPGGSTGTGGSTGGTGGTGGASAISTVVLPGMTPDEIVHAFGADTVRVLNGSVGDDLMNYYTGSAPRVLVGWAGKDYINGGSGSDLLIGGDGADKVVFDLRQAGPASHDIVGDLDFSAGDRVQILVPNDSIILSGTASILSAEAAGEISIQTLANGGLEITVAADPGRVIELHSTFDLLG